MIRVLARLAQAAIDIAMLSVAFWVAFLLRFEGELGLQMLKRLVFTWPYAVAFQYGLLASFGVTRFSWRYFGLREAKRLTLALFLSTVALLAVRQVAILLAPQLGYAVYAHVPGGVIVIDFVLALLCVAGVRVARRVQGERTSSRRYRAQAEPVRTMLIGAGEAGVMVAKEITNRPDLGVAPVGFLDDDLGKHGTVIHGLRVIGPTDQAAVLCAQLDVQNVLITIANASGASIRRITMLCHEAGLTTKIIPGLYEIVGGQVNLSRIRDVAIEDLLGRAPVTLDEEEIAKEVQGKTIMVTGAGGSIGSELCRQLVRFSPARLVLVEQAENNLFFIHRELQQLGNSLSLTPCVADVCDSRRMEELFAEFRPEVVVHAAAHKHVPMMEWNPGEAIKNNVFGTRKVADLADRFETQRFVLVSTDKAVNPSSVMGASKRLAELYVQALSERSRTRFVTVRFGNVLDSAGSVIPIFKQQIANGGPVTVTHPEMRRYFMTIPEACQLVLQAGTMGRGGEIFLLDMGEPIKISDLATDLIRLSGFRPGEDIEVVFTGLRPGEKLFEELSVAAENANKTRHPKIFIGKLEPHALTDVEQRLAVLHESLASSIRPDEIRAKIVEVLREYRPSSVDPPVERSQSAVSRVAFGQRVLDSNPT